MFVAWEGSVLAELFFAKALGATFGGFFGDL